MKAVSSFLPVFAGMLLLLGFCMGGCRGKNRLVESVDSEVSSTAIQREVLSPEEIKKLESEIASGRQNIENIEAFVQMEREKVKEDSNYDTSLLQEALNEQQGIKEAVESGEKRLKEIARPGE